MVAGLEDEGVGTLEGHGEALMEIDGVESVCGNSVDIASVIVGGDHACPVLAARMMPDAGGGVEG